MSVKVAVRVRPFNSRQQKLGCQCIVDMQDPTTILKSFQGQAERKFTFDYSFWSFDGFETQPDGYMKATGSKYADQTQVFEKIGKKILDNAWEGYHCCLFAYGQTGSGKSYSMIGYGPNKGIVPITCNQIFERMKNKEAGLQYQVSASMLEIYNEQVQDLTIPIKDRVAGGLKIRQNKLLGVYVDGVKKHVVTSFAQIENVMDMGTKNRTVAATQMNATSSRAHTIITVQFRQVRKVGQKKSQKVSMINLVDLAGSQRQDKTGATGQRFKEAVGINQSLTCLGQVISILAKNADGGKDFVPYRNSVLTRILQNALGGNSQTIMICAISPANDNYDESLSTLRYADQAKKIKNKPVVNESQTDKLIRSLKQQNERLKKMMEGKGMNTSPQGDGNQANSQQLKKKEQQMKRKQQQMRKRQQESAKKQQEQLQRLKKLEQQLAKKQQQRQQMIKKKEQQAAALQIKLKQAEANDQDFEKLKKQIQQKKKQDQIKQKKVAEQQAKLLNQQKQQEKILEQQKLAIQKEQEEHKKYVEEMEKKLKQTEEEKKNSVPKKESEQQIQASINKVNQALNQLKMSQQQIKKQAAKDQQQMKKANEDDTILSKKTLQQKQKKQKTLPPYFENISKDVMINRKMKLVLQKNVINIGKSGCSPPNDIIFGGRDVNPRHATIHIIDQKVFLKPLSKDSHLYINGKKVTETVELVNLDRVIFGWNSCYLFKNKHDNRSDEKINDKQITWDFVRDEVEHLVDIDQSDTQDGGGCCQIF